MGEEQITGLVYLWEGIQPPLRGSSSLHFSPKPLGPGALGDNVWECLVAELRSQGPEMRTQEGPPPEPQ